MVQANKDHPSFVDANELRTRFAVAMSRMYREEVPLYGDLVKIVHDINAVMLEDVISKTSAADTVALRASIERLTLERHGAIRLGTPYELQIVKRIFAVLGMHPIGYYDFSVAGLPMHATCFRPKDTASLDRNPFRIFTTLFRPELLASKDAREQALTLLEQRRIFTDRLLDLLNTADKQDTQLNHEQAEIFVPEALLSFSWRSVAAATLDQYQLLRKEHPILADIACFQSAHINHLSRRDGTQTSFLALDETVNFKADSPSSEGHLVKGRHKARFGEIEERGAAVTPKGRALYDKLLGESMAESAKANPKQADAIIAAAFQQYPDDWTQLRQQGLIYCEFRSTKKEGVDALQRDNTISLLEQLIIEGYVEVFPITYEDFLPFSAAGIFQSNLQSQGPAENSLRLQQSNANPEDFERALQDKVMDIDEWYSRIQNQSLEAVCSELGLRIEQLV